ncbi:MAG: RNA polymerase sigma factor [Planctomycetota bacterium]|nr:RNA polymerase sigma factor [Planctomycetota bacterium]
MRPDAPDENLLFRLQQQEPQAADEAFARHGRMVFNACLRVLGDASRAEDAMQAVFLLLMHKAPGFGPGTVLAAWLYRSAVFVSRESMREEARRLRREQEAQRMQAASVRAEDPEAEAEAEWREIAPRLDAAMAGLPESFRAPLVLTYLQGLSHAEAAVALRIPEGTLKSRVSRALEALRRKLGARLSVAALGALLAQRGAEAALPAAYAASLSGLSATPAAGQLLALSIKALNLAQLKTALAVCALVVAAGASVPLGLALFPEAGPPRTAAPEAARADASEPDGAGVPGFLGRTITAAPGQAVDGVRLRLLASETRLVVGGTPLNLDLEIEAADGQPHTLLLHDFQLEWECYDPDGAPASMDMLIPHDTPPLKVRPVEIAPGRPYRLSAPLGGEPVSLQERRSGILRAVRFFFPGRYRLAVCYTSAETWTETELDLSATAGAKRVFQGELRSNFVEFDVENPPRGVPVEGLELRLQASANRILPAGKPVELTLTFACADEKARALFFGTREPQLRWEVSGPEAPDVRLTTLRSEVRIPEQTVVERAAPGRPFAVRRALEGLPLSLTEHAGARRDVLQMFSPGVYRIHAVYANRGDKPLQGGPAVPEAWHGEVRSNTIELTVDPLKLGGDLLEPGAVVDGLALKLEAQAERGNFEGVNLTHRLSLESADGKPHTLLFGNRAPQFFWAVIDLAREGVSVVEEEHFVTRGMPKTTVRTVNARRSHEETRAWTGRGAPLTLVESVLYSERRLTLAQPGRYQVFAVYANHTRERLDPGLTPEQRTIKDAWLGVVASNPVEIEVPAVQAPPPADEPGGDREQF